MADPIAGAGGDAIKRAAQVQSDLAAQKDETKKTGPSKFDEVMKSKELSPAEEIEETKKILQTDLQTQVNQVSEAEKANLQQEFDNKIAKLEKPEQIRYFAVHIRESKEVFLRMKSKSPQVDAGMWKDKMVERLDDFGVEYGKMESMLEKMSSGHQFSQQELMSLQVRAHQISQSVEMLSKVVEHSVGGMKTIFQTSV